MVTLSLNEALTLAAIEARRGDLEEALSDFEIMGGGRLVFKEAVTSLKERGLLKANRFTPQTHVSTVPAWLRAFPLQESDAF